MTVRPAFLLCLFLSLVLYCRPAPALMMNLCSSRSFEETMKASELVFKGAARAQGQVTDAMQSDYKKGGSALPGMEKLPDYYTDYDVITIYKGILPASVRVFHAWRTDSPGQAGVSVQAKRVGYLYVAQKISCAELTPEKLDDLQATLAGLDEMIRIFPTSPDPYFKKIAVYQQYDAAENILATVSEMNKNVAAGDGGAATQSVIGRAQYVAGRYDEALKTLIPVPGEEAEKYRQLALLRLGRIKELDGKKLQFSGQEITDVTFGDIDLSGADFSGARLSGVRFINVTLKAASFRQAQLNVDIQASRLQGANFQSASMRGRFLDCRLDETNFSGATLDLKATAGNAFTRANFSGAKIRIDATSPASGEKAKNDFTAAVFLKATVEGIGTRATANANFAGAAGLKTKRNDVPGGEDKVDLSKQDLSGVSFDNARLAGANFKATKLQKASFRGADLSGADFTGADLREADLRGSRGMSRPARIAGADFSDANLSGALLEGGAFDCQTKFPQGFDPLAQRLEPLDSTCARLPANGIVSYSAEQYAAGGMNVCYGALRSACAYGFLVGYALSLGEGDLKQRTMVLYKIAKTLKLGGEDKLARLALYRAYAEFRLLFPKDKGVPPSFLTLLRETGTDLKIEGEPDTGASKVFTGPRLSPQRMAAMEAIAATDKGKALKIIQAAFSDVRQAAARKQSEMLLDFADLLLSADGALTAEARSELERQLRTTPLHLKKRGALLPADYVSEGEKLLRAQEASMQPAWSGGANASSPPPAGTSTGSYSGYLGGPPSDALQNNPSGRCPAGWEINPALAQQVRMRAKGGVLLDSPLASDAVRHYGVLLAETVNFSRGRDTYSDSKPGFVDLDGVTFASVEVLQLENGVPNAVHVLAPGLAMLDEKRAEISGDAGKDTVYLDGCLQWSGPVPVPGMTGKQRYTATDASGNLAAVDIDKGLEVRPLAPEKISAWKIAVENYGGAVYLPDAARNIGIYQEWLSRVAMPPAKKAFGIILSAMKAGQLPTEFLQRNRGARGDMLLSPFYMQGRVDAGAEIPADDPTCKRISLFNYFNQVNILTAQKAIDLAGCVPGDRAYLLSNAPDKLSVNGGVNTIYPAGGGGVIRTGDGTDIIILEKGWGKLTVNKPCGSLPQAPFRIVGRVSPPRAFGGIGVAFDKLEDGMLIRRVTPQEAADRGGLKAGQVIVAINGSPVSRMTREEVLVALRGEPGSPITLTYRDADKVGELNVVLLRTMIKAPATSQNRLDQAIIPLDYKWPFKYTGFIVFGEGIHPEDIVLTEQMLSNSKTGDSVAFSSGACFNLAYSALPELQELQHSAPRAATVEQPDFVAEREGADLIFLNNGNTRVHPSNSFSAGDGDTKGIAIQTREGRCILSVDSDGRIVNAHCRR